MRNSLKNMKIPKDLVTNKSVIQIKNPDTFGKKDFKAINVANMVNMKLFMVANWFWEMMILVATLSFNAINLQMKIHLWFP